MIRHKKKEELKQAQRRIAFLEAALFKEWFPGALINTPSEIIRQDTISRAIDQEMHKRGYGLPLAAWLMKHD
jgi:hypothetical protein